MKKEWFSASAKGMRHKEVFNAMQTLRMQQLGRIRDIELNKLLYQAINVSNGSIIAGAGTDTLMNNSNMSLAFMNRNQFSENLIKSCVDTIYAKIGKNAPIPFTLTDGGDGELRRKAKDMNKYLWGKFHELSVHQFAREALRDALPLGTGILKIDISKEKKNIALTRIMINQVFVDNLESQYSKPRQIFVVYPENKQKMQALYPAFAANLESAAGPSPISFPLRKKGLTIIDEVEIVEAWKLPDEVGGKGRHTLVASNCTLVDEPYEFMDFPLVMIHFEQPVLGYWGEGISQILSDTQFRVNFLIETISENIRLCGFPTYFAEQGSNLLPGHLRNEAGNVVYYKKGSAIPQLLAFQTTNQEVFNWLNDQRQRAFEMVGVSQLSAQSQKPAGLNSGVAMETYNDIESERFYMLGKQFEQLIMDISTKIIDLTAWAWKNKEKLGKEIHDNMFTSQFSRSWQPKKINWKDVDMQKDEYSLQIFPVSSLPQSPAGKQEKIQEYMQQNMIDRDVGRELMDFPDYNRYSSLLEASKDNAERIVEELYFNNTQIEIEEYHNLAYMGQYAQMLFNRQQEAGDEEEPLDRLRTFIDAVNKQLNDAAAAQQAQAAQAPAPAAPPVQQ